MQKKSIVFTLQEQNVLNLLAKGFSAQRVAEILEISISSVRSYKNRLRSHFYGSGHSLEEFMGETVACPHWQVSCPFCTLCSLHKLSSDLKISFPSPEFPVEV